MASLSIDASIVVNASLASSREIGLDCRLIVLIFNIVNNSIYTMLHELFQIRYR